MRCGAAMAASSDGKGMRASSVRSVTLARGLSSVLLVRNKQQDRLAFLAETAEYQGDNHRVAAFCIYS